MQSFNQQRISRARFMVVGCGALGNEVLKCLVLQGARRIMVVDFDVVEHSNLNRSVLFRVSDADARRPKVEAAAERLRELAPGVEVTAVNGDFIHDVGLGLIRRMDVVIGCVDSRWARYCINRQCMRAGVPWIDGGISGLEGTVRVFAPGRNCYACNLGPEGLADMAVRRPCSGTIRRAEEAGHAPTTPIVASVIGAMQAQEALKLVSPELLDSTTVSSLCGRIFYYDGQHATASVADFRAFDPDCPCHELWSPVAETGLTVDNTIGEALELLGPNSSIYLIDNSFVDFVEQRESGRQIKVMCPAHRVAEAIDADSQAAGLPLSSFYQHEYHEIVSSFPYKHLTLGQIGIPPQAVLSTIVNGCRKYLEIK